MKKKGVHINGGYLMLVNVMMILPMLKGQLGHFHTYLYVSDLFHFSCENAGECVELDGDLIDIESDSDGGDTEGTCTDMEDAVDIENAVIENLGNNTLKTKFYCSD